VPGTIRKLCQGKSKDEMRVIYEIVRAEYKRAIDIAIVEASRQFQIGDHVKFRPRKNRIYIKGEIVKLNPKTAQLGGCSDGRRWKVHYSALERD